MKTFFNKNNTLLSKTDFNLFHLNKIYIIYRHPIQRFISFCSNVLLTRTTDPVSYNHEHLWMNFLQLYQIHIGTPLTKKSRIKDVLHFLKYLNTHFNYKNGKVDGMFIDRHAISQYLYHKYFLHKMINKEERYIDHFLNHSKNIKWIELNHLDHFIKHHLIPLYHLPYKKAENKSIDNKLVDTFFYHKDDLDLNIEDVWMNTSLFKEKIMSTLFQKDILEVYKDDVEFFEKKNIFSFD
jgi:hypothetical protein